MALTRPGTWVCCLLLVAGGAHAQEDPAEADAVVVEPTAEVEAEEPARAADPAEKAAPPKREATLEERRVHQLRELEARLSVGQPLTDEERRLLALVAVRGETPRARALAAAILPWLPPAESAPALLAAAEDIDPRVRDQALQGLVAISRRLDGALAQQAQDVGSAHLTDASAEVACTAARVLAGLAPERAAAEVRELAPDVEDVRYACWRRLVPMPEREVEVPPPVEPADAVAPSGDEPPPMAAAPKAPPTGDVLFVASSAATGFLAGGLLPGLFAPPRDTLLYTTRRTVHAREEPSVAFAGTTALAGALLVGGAALGTSVLLGPVEVPAATSTVLGTAAGAVGGLGAGMVLGFDGGLTGLVSTGAALSGLALSSALAFTLPPQPNDIGFSLGLAGQGALAGTLIALAAVPLSAERVIGDSTRVDFALGTGLVSGGALALGGLLLAPLVDFSPGRVLVASAAGASAAGIGLGLTYLFTPVGLDVRERVASGIGAGLQLVVATTTFVLLPSSWADAVLPSHAGPPPATALYLDEGKLRLGLPVVSFVPAQDGVAPSVGVPLLGGRF